MLLLMTSASALLLLEFVYREDGYRQSEWASALVVCWYRLYCFGNIICMVLMPVVLQKHWRCETISVLITAACLSLVLCSWFSRKLLV